MLSVLYSLFELCLCVQVFEVNASSSRQGRHILAQLQEATQSHQVAQKKDGIIFSPSSLTPSRQKLQLTGVYGFLDIVTPFSHLQHVCMGS